MKCAAYCIMTSQTYYQISLQSLSNLCSVSSNGFLPYSVHTLGEKRGFGFLVKFHFILIFFLKLQSAAEQH